MWWEIYRIIREKVVNGNPVKYLCLENVDRLISSPVKQNGRDFAIMLGSLSDLGYAVEWRVVNAADYGFPQRRKRVFIMGYHCSTEIYKRLSNTGQNNEWLVSKGVLAKSFPTIGTVDNSRHFSIDGDLVEVNWNKTQQFDGKTPFANTGFILNRMVTTQTLKAFFEGRKMNLGDVLLPSHQIEEQLYLDPSVIPKWAFYKGAKKLDRVDKNSGRTYSFKEGSQSFPDPLDKPSRTIITNEGGSAASRTTHVIATGEGRLRRLMPVEIERLNLFPDNHTAAATNNQRGFLMGNALVVGIVEQIGRQLAKDHFS